MATLCREIDAARLEHGLGYADLGRAVNLSGEQVARICRGDSRNLTVVRAAMLCAAVGQDLSARTYPSGPPVRDAAHIALLGRLRARIGTRVRWLAEVPVAQTEPEPGRPIDRRAWDAVLIGPGWRVAVEAETRLSDIQSLLRRVALKQRDGGVAAVLLLVNDTAHNRRLVRDPTLGLREQFPGSARLALGRLADGRPLESNALVVL